MNRKKQMSDRFLIGALLALAGGFMDAYTYLCRGGVFANAQTGNIVLFGIRIAEGNFWGSLFYLIPIAAFVVGIFAALLVRRHFQMSGFHWRQSVLLAEICITVGVAFIPYGEWTNAASNILISFVCSLQVQSFRKIEQKAMATTMCTGNLRSASESFFNFCVTKHKDALVSALIYTGIILFFIVGAVLGAWLTAFFSLRALLFASAVLIVIFFLLFVRHEEQKKESQHADQGV